MISWYYCGTFANIVLKFSIFVSNILSVPNLFTRISYIRSKAWKNQFHHVTWRVIVRDCNSSRPIKSMPNDYQYPFQNVGQRSSRLKFVKSKCGPFLKLLSLVLYFDFCKQWKLVKSTFCLVLYILNDYNMKTNSKSSISE